jgi:hypothetical protein
MMVASGRITAVSAEKLLPPSLLAPSWPAGVKRFATCQSVPHLVAPSQTYKTESPRVHSAPQELFYAR